MTADLMAILARTISGVNARWVGCKPDTKQRIYFANHTSNLDALVLWAVLPPEVRALTRPVAARDYWAAGRLRRYLAEKVLYAILIERKKPTAHDNPIEQIIEAMGDTGSIIIFPEGGRFSGPDPMPFKSGLYHLARKRPVVELVPVLMDNLNRILPKGEVLPVPLLGSVTFGTAIQLLDGESKPAFLERAWRDVVKLRDL
jgi:1-acyl-sn-glycerol-3-phosphate acyltransferase